MAAPKHLNFWVTVCGLKRGALQGLGFHEKSRRHLERCVNNPFRKWLSPWEREALNEWRRRKQEAK